MWSFLENPPWALEKNMYSAILVWSVLNISVKRIWSSVSFKAIVSLLIFCLQKISCGTFVSGHSHIEARSFYPFFHEGLFFFIKKGCCCILSNVYSASMERLVWLLSFLLSTWYITSVDLRILNRLCIPGIKSTSLCWIILFVYCRIQFATLCWDFLHPWSSGKLVCSFPF